MFHPNKDLIQSFLDFFVVHRLIFKPDFYLLEELLFAHNLEVIRINFTSYDVSMDLKKIVFWLNLRLQTLVFHLFSYFKYVFFKFDVEQLEDLSFEQIFIVPWKKIISNGANTHILEKKFCKLYTQIEISNVCFSLFLCSSGLFFKSDCQQLEGTFFASLIVNWFFFQRH